MTWRHSGFNVYCGNTIWPNDQDGLEQLARYIIRASFSSERMTPYRGTGQAYIPESQSRTGTATVIYESRACPVLRYRDGRTSKTFDALDWLAQLTTHIPNRREQMCRYYGYYSNKARGVRKKAGTDDHVPALMEPGMISTAMRQKWAQLIQKIFNCSGNAFFLSPPGGPAHNIKYFWKFDIQVESCHTFWCKKQVPIPQSGIYGYPFFYSEDRGSGRKCDL